MVDTPWGGFTPAAAVQAADQFLAVRGAGGINFNAVALADFIGKNAADGTVGAPGMAFAGDSDTGIFRPGANQLGLAVGGLQRLNVDANGNISMGGQAVAVNALRYFDVFNADGGANSGAIVRLITSNVANTGNVTFDIVKYRSGGVLLSNNETNAAAYMALAVAGSERVRVDGSGNVGVGIAAPASKMDVNGSLAVASGSFLHTPYNGPTNTGTVRSGIQCDGVNQTLNFYTANGYRGQFTSIGNLVPGADNVQAFGGASSRWSVIYAVSGTINTSDERAKDIEENGGIIPAEWLDAWAAVEWVRYKFKDAIEEKGDAARWHVGLIAQRVRDAFDAVGLDARAIGLLCYDEWEEQREPIFEERQVGTETVIVGRVDTGLFDATGAPVFRDVTEDRPIMAMIDTGETRVTLEAGDRWGLRYDECQAMEAAWQRRELARNSAISEERIAGLEAMNKLLSDRLAALEAAA